MKKTIVNASDVGKAAYCAHSLSLSKLKVKAHGSSVKLQEAGTRDHDELTDAVMAERSSQRTGQVQDSRCYVATYAFGEHHPVTQSLRDWRDDSLLAVPAGRVLVGWYYVLSPHWVRLCKRSSVLSFVSRLVVSLVCHCVIRWK